MTRVWLHLQVTGFLSSLTSQGYTEARLLEWPWYGISPLLLSSSITLDRNPSNDFFLRDLMLYLELFTCCWPVFGWLADGYFGRYRFMRLSIYVLWICGIFYVMSEIFKNSSLLEKGHKIINVVGIIFLAALMVSFGAYQVNAVMFGVDQLIDSSSQDISSYISWYVWVYFFVI